MEQDCAFELGQQVVVDGGVVVVVGGGDDVVGVVVVVVDCCCGGGGGGYDVTLHVFVLLELHFVVQCFNILLFIACNNNFSTKRINKKMKQKNRKQFN